MADLFPTFELFPKGQVHLLLHVGHEHGVPLTAHPSNRTRHDPGVTSDQILEFVARLRHAPPTAGHVAAWGDCSARARTPGARCQVRRFRPLTAS